MAVVGARISAVLLLLSSAVSLLRMRPIVRSPMEFRGTVLQAKAVDKQQGNFAVLSAAYTQNQTGRPLRKREIILQWLDAVFHFIDGMV